jgi:uncharacterized protein
MLFGKSVMKTIFTIHDVLPKTLVDAQQIIKLMNANGLTPATLLVSPGREWTHEQLETLRQLTRRGHALAGHGWAHQARCVTGWKHRLHSLVLSRNAAEHLAWSADETETTLRRCHAWFVDNGFPPPELYVPPAWGLGKLSRKKMRALPFLRYETLAGIYNAKTDVFKRLPLIGFEADTSARKIGLRIFNALNLAFARFSGIPPRIAVHPHDLKLRLARELRQMITASTVNLRP